MASRLFAIAVAGLLILGTSAASAAPSVSVLHSFAGPEGEVPSAPLVQGGDGLLYGVARYGGDFTVMPPDGGGTIFRTDGAGNVTTLHAFVGEDGAVPTGLTRGQDGMFYGTTVYGGVPGPDSLDPGPGTIFRIDASGNFTRLFVLPGWEAATAPALSFREPTEPSTARRSADPRCTPASRAWSSGSTRVTAATASSTRSRSPMDVTRPDGCSRPPTGSSTARRTRAERSAAASSTR